MFGIATTGNIVLASHHTERAFHINTNRTSMGWHEYGQIPHNVSYRTQNISLRHIGIYGQERTNYIVFKAHDAIWYDTMSVNGA